MVLITPCQSSFLTATDSGLSEINIQRDKWAFNAWDRSDIIQQNALFQILNTKCPGCLGLNGDQTMLEGHGCNTGLGISMDLKFKFIVVKAGGKSQKPTVNIEEGEKDDDKSEL